MMFASCENDLEPYSDPACRLNFIYYDYFGDQMTTENIEESYDDDSYSTSSYSFVYAGNPERDTLWFKVGVSGFLSDQPRSFALEQVAVPDTVDNAEPGVHYVAFNDPSLSALYTVPANADTLSVPVVLLRDPSLDEKDVVIRFTFADNGNFQAGIPEMSTRTVYITARIAQPSMWEEYYLGYWGPVKHQLMIEWTGEAWDDAYLEELYNGDSGYVDYMISWFAQRLEEENAAREAAGEEPYTEEDGTPVDVTPIYNYENVR